MGGRPYPPLIWHCADCGQQVTDRAGAGRPIHVEHGYAAGCRRLRRDQAANAARRCAQLDGTAEDYALLDRIEVEELRSFPDRGWAGC